MTILLAVLALAAPPTLASLAEREAGAWAGRAVPPPDRYVVLSARAEGGSREAAAGTALEALEIVGPDNAGIVRVRFRILEGDEPRGEIRATVRGRVLGPALVARKTLRRGEPVPGGAVAVEDTDLTRLPSPALRDASALVGLVPKRSLGIGRVLAAALFEAEPVVRRGDPVEMRVERGALVVVARAIALGDGAPGDVIAAENGSTGVRVRTLVLPDGSLLVSDGPRRPR